ncbi:hypothetical protein LCGC14_1562220 [marine sediment metagenome]|uniref:Uncharacterized protein n=1 Tax=marine sediment metagenome TaxID=412755 RepID=A0A0F9L3L9_9ZZZZ
MKTIIYGTSDDLIEIEGDFREEFCGGSEEGELLAFSDGTLAKIKYDGVWRITPIVKGKTHWTKTEAVSAEDDNYSDRLTLVGDISWVCLGTEYTATRKQKESN